MRDALKNVPERASVGDELQQIAKLATTIAEKLEIADQVKAVRAFQEAEIQASRNVIDSFRNSVKVFSELFPQKSEDELFAKTAKTK